MQMAVDLWVNAFETVIGTMMTNETIKTYIVAGIVVCCFGIIITIVEGGKRL